MARKVIASALTASILAVSVAAAEPPPSPDARKEAKSEQAAHRRVGAFLFSLMLTALLGGPSSSVRISTLSNRKALPVRARFGLIASLVMMLVIGCNTVDPDECWVNTSGGFGGGGTIPIGAGVGATSSGDFGTPPGSGPLAAEGVENPCVTMGAVTFASYSPSEFPFVTIVQDDGTGKAGGWQQAKANLEFIKKRREGSISWTCSLTIEMPIRPEAYGTISASKAAIMSAEVAEEAAYGMDFNLPQGIFCDRFRTAMDVTFKSNYPKLGSTVRK